MKFETLDGAGDVDKLYVSIAETMKLFGKSAYGKTMTNKEVFVDTTYATENNIGNKINNPRFKDLEELYSKSYEVISAKWDIKLDLPFKLVVLFTKWGEDRGGSSG